MSPEKQPPGPGMSHGTKGRSFPLHWGERFWERVMSEVMFPSPSSPPTRGGEILHVQAKECRVGNPSTTERKARDVCLEVTLRFPQRGNLARFAPRSPLCGTLPTRRSYGLLSIHPEPWENREDERGLLARGASQKGSSDTVRLPVFEIVPTRQRRGAAARRPSRRCAAGSRQDRRRSGQAHPAR